MSAARVHLGTSEAPGVCRPVDDLLQPRERAAHDEQHVGGVDLDELLVRVLATACGGTEAWCPRGFSAAPAAALAGTSRVIDGFSALAGDLVDLVDGDDAGLRRA